jgi:hypothetical protein
MRSNIVRFIACLLFALLLVGTLACTKPGEPQPVEQIYVLDAIIPASAVGCETKIYTALRYGYRMNVAVSCRGVSIVAK